MESLSCLIDLTLAAQKLNLLKSTQPSASQGHHNLMRIISKYTSYGDGS